MRRSLLVCAFAAVCTPALLAVNSPFTGTWKVDPGKSSYTGLTLTYTKLENGSWHFATSDGTGFDIGFEGKEYSAGGGATVSQTLDGENAWNSVWKLNGKVTSNDRGQISADGKTLTLTQNRIRPDGSIGTSVGTLTRVSGASGPAGTWRLEKSTTEIYTRVMSSAADGVMRWEIPENKQITEGKLDGSDLPVTGPEVPQGQTEAFTIVSPIKISYTVKMGGKPIYMGTRTISEDGKTLTDESWPPGKESEKSVETFIRQ